jgi:hypothetical protein
MWPTIFEFSWDTGHMIFLGVFYAVLIVLTTALGYAVLKSIVDVFAENAAAAQNHASNPPSKETPAGETPAGG